MKSTIKVQAKFDFRGETFCYQADIDLPASFADFDLFLQQLPNRIAKLNNLDVISYKFEMLESSEIEVIGFQSRIASTITELPMRVEQFLETYLQVGADAFLQVIAEDHQLDLKANPDIAKALKAAYELGQQGQPHKHSRANHNALSNQNWF
ncbi:hypothetical protein [Thiomicrorhabdus sediminis]|uniref:Uncharacterized protein n=1 Tax=Thiomicrorhabdus sediminis TaxID=2580412 RepID=A0A4P9K6Q4_9GAMM|nr:hypothetical protein [Thiomicrorhabdus sediminis]QCU89917.1 hypothetical protein FE785_04335 [Thiomicrorhabdus sediminis]